MKLSRAGARIASFLALFVVILKVSEARATVVACRAFRHGQVTLHHCVNHGYYPRYLDLSLSLEVEAMEKLRRALVRAGVIDRRPLVVVVPPWVGYTRRGVASIARLDHCERIEGDGGAQEEEAGPSGPCHLLDTSGLPTRWSTFRTLMAGLKTLTAAKPEREVKDLDKAAERWGAGALVGVTVDGPIVRSAGGARAAAVRFRDGRYGVVLRAQGDETIHFGSGDPIFPGMCFSEDGRRLAWATRERVSLLGAEAQLRALELARFFPGDDARHLVRLRFDGPEALEVVADRELLNRFDVLRWSLPTDAAAIVVRDRPAPPW